MAVTPEGFPLKKKVKKSVDASKTTFKGDAAMKQTKSEQRLKLIRHRFHRLFGKPIMYQLPVTRKEIRDTTKEVILSFKNSMDDSLASGDEFIAVTSLGFIGGEKAPRELNPFLTRKERNQLLREVTEFKKAKEKFLSGVHNAPLLLMA